ncbi:CocE/NonD family hydrolase [Amycolatopsis sp. NPDC058986]|uniref:alpha/beta hydrolase n=1 Tax=unclassified Amycolatopsis TaxID=2618356 RepID=UPI00366D8BF8
MSGLRQLEKPPRRRVRGSRRWALVAAVSVLTAGLTGVARADDAVVNGCVTSVPDPGTTAPVSICYTVFRPPGASADKPVPLIFDSHGWGGSRATAASAFADFLGAGFGVLSFDQRGFGQSGGQAQLENPDYEGQDVQRLVDLVAGLDWVAKQAPGDPVLGAMGGSYGGGYQFVGAFSELRDRGRTRFDALAPQITWYDLAGSLAPQGVPRSEWPLLLYLAGIPSNANPPVVTTGLLESLATGNFPDSLAAFMAHNGPQWNVGQGRRLDIPVLFGQGITDNLFPLEQGLKNFQNALTPQARSRSIFVGYNGGHTLPSVFPPGAPGAVDVFSSVQATGDPCSAQLGGSDFRALSLRFFTEQLLGKPTGLGGQGTYHLATLGGRCQTVESTAASTAIPVGTLSSPVGLGLPQSIPLARGPVAIAGTPTLDAGVTSTSPDGRLFMALSVGTSALDAKIVQNNMLPLRRLGGTEQRSGVELPSVAVDVPAGQSLFLTVSPISDLSFAHGSRIPGIMTLQNTVVRLPVVR